MKTYCISDVHGHLNNLMDFVDTLEEDDRVFVLGDVIDKGDDSIKCLEFIMHDHRFTMLLGNHEYMMFELLSANPDSYESHEAYEIWVTWNEGYETLKQYLELPRYKQLEIFNYINNLPLNKPNLKVNNRTFYLVHSCPHSNMPLTMADVEYDDETISSYIWDRVNPFDKLDDNDQIVIAGHTVVQHYLESKTTIVRPVSDSLDNDLSKAHYIDIDGGLAYGLPGSKLIVLCLDDLSYRLF